ncbi:hypothetical protein [Sphingomonas sp. R86520]|uniref:hypothetical protein n=1 Tax=Sphingomonas sp. R86520 TaxID=3093859 RepID=UPI0036D36E2B
MQNLNGLTSLGQNAAAGVGNNAMNSANNIGSLLNQQGAAIAGGADRQGQRRGEQLQHHAASSWRDCGVLTMAMGPIDYNSMQTRLDFSPLVQGLQLRQQKQNIEADNQRQEEAGPARARDKFYDSTSRSTPHTWRMSKRTRLTQRQHVCAISV